MLNLTAAYVSNRLPGWYGDPVQGVLWQGDELEPSQNHRRHSLRPYRDLDQVNGRQCLGGWTLRIKSRHQDLPCVQPGDAQGSGDDGCCNHRDATRYGPADRRQAQLDDHE